MLRYRQYIHILEYVIGNIYIHFTINFCLTLNKFVTYCQNLNLKIEGIIKKTYLGVEYHANVFENLLILI